MRVPASARRFVFPLCVTLVILAQLAVVIPGLFWTRLWEDEAYNLSVSLNLIHGLGYTSDGFLGGGGLIAYDTRVSTGPIVLLPVAGMLATGIDPVLGARLVMVMFYAALLVGLWMLGRRIAGRWGALAAVTAVLGLNIAQLPSPVQGPTDVLGELPAAACIVWALYVIMKRPWLAGLLIGLAIQSKTLAALAIPALGIGVLVAVAQSSLGARVRRGLVFAAFVVLPSVVFEIVKLVTLGLAGYIENVRAFGAFLRDGGQTLEPTSAASKVAGVLESWFVPWWLVLVLLIAAAVIVVFALRRVRRQPPVAAGFGRERSILLGMLALLLLTWLGWWLVSTHTPGWIRYPSSVLQVVVPLSAAFLVFAVRPAFTDRARAVRGVLGIVAATVVAITVAQVSAHAVAAWTPLRGETLPEQRVAAAAIAASNVPQFRGSWGAPVSVAVLANVHLRLLDTTGDALPLLLANLDPAKQAAFDAKVAKECDTVLVRVGGYIACTSVGVESGLG